MLALVRWTARFALVFLLSLVPLVTFAHPIEEPAHWDVFLTKTRRCSECRAGVSLEFGVRNMITGALTSFALANQTERVSKISVPQGANTAAILGKFGGSSVVTIVSLPDGKVKDSFQCAWPSFSPDGKFLAFRKWFPAHLPAGIWFSDEYLVYDLTRGPKFNRAGGKSDTHYGPGLPVYPPNAVNRIGPNIVRTRSIKNVHSMASTGFFWLDKKDILAFVDRYRGDNQLIIVNLCWGVLDARSRVIPLAASKFVHFPSCKSLVAPSDFRRWSKNPALLIYAKHIGVLQGDPARVRINLAPNPCLASQAVDVPVPWLDLHPHSKKASGH